MRSLRPLIYAIRRSRAVGCRSGWDGSSTCRRAADKTPRGPFRGRLHAARITARVIDAAVEEFGHIDILIANHAHGLTGALETLTAESIDAALLVNVRATLLLIKYFAGQHNGRPGGRVVMMTSGQHREPMPSELAYVASKGAIHQLTRSLSDHLVRRGITVNTVNPGATDTGWADEATRHRVLERQPQGRWGMPEDAARLIAWLVSDDGQWVTGEMINSTGGGD